MEWWWLKHSLLHGHNVAYTYSDYESAYATADNENKRFEYEDPQNYSLWAAETTHDWYFLGLIENIGSHTWAQREEAKAHWNGNDCWEDFVHRLDFLVEERLVIDNPVPKIDVIVVSQIFLRRDMVEVLRCQGILMEKGVSNPL